MSRHAGASLVEMMVATTIGSIVTVGAMAAMAQARASWAATQVESRLNERAQYVLGTLEVDVQMAGYFAGVRPSPQDASLPAGAAACGRDVIAMLNQPLSRGASHWPHACAPNGGGHLAGTHVLLIRRASARLALPGTGRLRWLSCPTSACESRLLLPHESAPGAGALPLHAEIRDLVARIFYVAREADADPATPALRVKSLTAIAGEPAFIDTEVMPGVEDLQIEFEAGPVAAVPEQPHTVRIAVTVRADAADQPAGQPVRRLTASRQFALRNIVPPT